MYVSVNLVWIVSDREALNWQCGFGVHGAPLRSWDLRSNCNTPSVRTGRDQVSLTSVRVGFSFCPFLLVLRLSNEKVTKLRGRAIQISRRTLGGLLETMVMACR